MGLQDPPRYVTVGIGALFGSIGLYFALVPIFRLREDCFEIRAAPAAPKKLVLYKQMTSVEKRSPKKAILHANVDGKPKTIGISLAMLAPSERARLLHGLREHIAS